MKITATRRGSTANGTPGRLVTEGGFECDTLELPWHNNERGISCILPDTYAASLWFSPHMNRTVVRLEDKHGRADCLIHAGNFAGDDFTQVHGCTEVGHGYGQIERPDGKMQFGILSSRQALEVLINQIGPGPHQVTYEWAPGCEP